MTLSAATSDGPHVRAPAIELSGVSKHYRTPRHEAHEAVGPVSLDVPAGRFVSLVGPSGCGKSTLLDLIAGLTQPTAGRVRIHGEPLRGLNRRATYLFQRDALLPWKTVLDNVVLGLRLRGDDPQAAGARGLAWLERVGLAGFAQHYPAQLSGGMRRRVAIAQTWIVDPDILLMDEPFSALDVHTRQLVEEDLLRLWARSPSTVIFVTHDLEEALALADEVVVLSAGPRARVVTRHLVDLPRPRDLIDIRTVPRFTALYAEVWSLLRSEVLRAHHRSDRIDANAAP